MDEEEIKILNKLYDEKHIVYSPEKIIVTRKFYNYIQDILATGYVEVPSAAQLRAHLTGAGKIGIRSMRGPGSHGKIHLKSSGRELIISWCYFH